MHPDRDNPLVHHLRARISLIAEARSGVCSGIGEAYLAPMKFDQTRAASDLAANGYTTLRLLDAATCRSLAALYDDDTRFRSRVVMQRHNFGRGEYKYLAYPSAGAGRRTA